MRRRPPLLKPVELLMGLVWHVLQDTGSLAEHIGVLTGKKTMSKAVSRRTQAAFAKVGVVTLVELGLHNPIGAAIGPSGESEMALAQRLLTHLPPKSLWISDRYYGVPALIMAVDEAHPQGDRQFLLRVRGNLKTRVVEVYPDGSALVEIKHGKQSRLVREIVGRVRRGRNQWSTVRLWTSLLDGRVHPAEELLALYCRRWEQEIFYKELKVDMRSSRLLQSHTQETAAQEIAALILAYAVLVDERIQAAKVGEVPVLRISFAKTLHLLRGLWQFLEVSEDILTPDPVKKVVKRTLRLIAQRAIPKRRQRSCPRQLRQPVSSYPGYIGGPKPRDFVDQAPVLALMQASKPEQSSRYREYVESVLTETDA